MRIGCHVSIKQGFSGAAKTAESLGCGAFQYFPKNPRSLIIKQFDPMDASRCAEFTIQHGMVSVAHAPYLVNLATDDAKLANITKQSLLNDLTIAEACGSIGVVVHVGKFSGKDPLQGYRNIIQLLNEVVVHWTGSAYVLLENQASGIGTTLDELVSIRNLINQPERIAFCLDTCHAFASGLWDGNNWQHVEERGRELAYWEHLKVVHLNDSRFPSGSNKDFHANIGHGYIGDNSFRQLLHSPIMRDKPYVLETPSNPNLSVVQEIQHVKELGLYSNLNV
jgi:deoxyribonuclease-4